jgi:hypothetical protein
MLIADAPSFVAVPVLLIRSLSQRVEFISMSRILQSGHVALTMARSTAVSSTLPKRFDV